MFAGGEGHMKMTAPNDRSGRVLSLVLVRTYGSGLGQVRYISFRLLAGCAVQFFQLCGVVSYR